MEDVPLVTMIVQLRQFPQGAQAEGSSLSVFPTVRETSPFFLVGV